MNRIAAAALVIALCFGTGCSDKDEATGAADKTTIQAREVPVIWSEILAERDVIQAAVAKKHEMWHEDCAAVAKAATRLETLTAEMLARVGQMTGLGVRRNGIVPLLGSIEILLTKLRTSAVQETVGDMPALMIALDAYLSGLENHFMPEEIGDDRVVTRPGFNPNAPPPPPSPV
jgi:hypothetical protein